MFVDVEGRGGGGGGSGRSVRTSSSSESGCSTAGTLKVPTVLLDAGRGRVILLIPSPRPVDPGMTGDVVPLVGRLHDWPLIPHPQLPLPHPRPVTDDFLIDLPVADDVCAIGIPLSIPTSFYSDDFLLRINRGFTHPLHLMIPVRLDNPQNSPRPPPPPIPGPGPLPQFHPINVDELPFRLGLVMALALALSACVGGEEGRGGGGLCGEGVGRGEDVYWAGLERVGGLGRVGSRASVGVGVTLGRSLRELGGLGGGHDYEGGGVCVR